MISVSARFEGGAVPVASRRRRRVEAMRATSGGAYTTAAMRNAKVITRLAVIWPCRQAQYEPGRTAHISLIICERANMDRANMTPYLPVFYFQTYSGDDCHHRFLNNCASARTRTRSARKFIT
jgi:hypothetical protein